jgi:hypothetical protein
MSMLSPHSEKEVFQMANPFQKRPVRRNGEASRARQNHSPSASQPGDGDEDIDSYIRVFVSNGLKLQRELMINREAMEAARNEWAENFQRKRQHGR